MVELEQSSHDLKARELPPVVEHFRVRSGYLGEIIYGLLPDGDLPLEQAASMIGRRGTETIGLSRRTRKAFVVTDQDGNPHETVSVKDDRTTVWLRREGEQVGFVEKGANPGPFNSFFSSQPDLTRLFRDATGWYHPASSDDQIIDVG